ncbi:MAG TPA: UDP-N-acetylglucosamine 2-epimerase (non-hydrolyzing) [Acidimicrobiales bacterium]|nr:UDP-N-acetylglucosamine 2-epimerase (non-hydrolyzing) [Acidimicrobiales bacterium]
MRRFACVVGARPNFVKMKPVLDALDGRGAETVLVHSGQHYSPELNDRLFTDLGLRAPDIHLGSGSGSHSTQVANVLTAFERTLTEVEPDVVIVVGDVHSTLAAALAAARTTSVVAHVEAGLRSRDWSMPEEVNRIVTDRVSDVLLAPSQDAVDNLRAEGCPPERIHLVGNVMIDSLLANVERARARPTLTELGLVAGRYGLVTLHRPASVDDPATLVRVLGVLGEIATELPLVFPVHPRTRSVVDSIEIPPGIRLTEPLGYLDFIALEADATVVFTDSGGVQEETTSLGVPCVTLRDSTERPITVTEGTNVVVGSAPAAIRQAARAAIDARVIPRRPVLWDGRAAERIADALLGELPPKGWWGGG